MNLVIDRTVIWLLPAWLYGDLTAIQISLPICFPFLHTVTIVHVAQLLVSEVLMTQTSGFIVTLLVQGYSKWLSGFLQLVIHNTLEIAVYVFFYLIEQHSKFLLHTLQVLYICTLCDSTNITDINWPTFMKCKHTKRLLTAVRRHLSKLPSKRRSA